MLQERQTMDEFDTRSFFWKLGSPTVLLLIAHKTQQNVLLSQIDSNDGGATIASMFSRWIPKTLQISG